jgi:hypothetical protein
MAQKGEVRVAKKIYKIYGKVTQNAPKKRRFIYIAASYGPDMTGYKNCN